MGESKRVAVVLKVDWDEVYKVLERQAKALPVNRNAG